jgi:hypothetical protein
MEALPTSPPELEASGHSSEPQAGEEDSSSLPHLLASLPPDAICKVLASCDVETRRAAVRASRRLRDAVLLGVEALEGTVDMLPVPWARYQRAMQLLIDVRRWRYTWRGSERMISHKHSTSRARRASYLQLAASLPPHLQSVCLGNAGRHLMADQARQLVAALAAGAASSSLRCLAIHSSIDPAEVPPLVVSLTSLASLTLCLSADAVAPPILDGDSDSDGISTSSSGGSDDGGSGGDDSGGSWGEGISAITLELPEQLQELSLSICTVTQAFINEHWPNRGAYSVQLAGAASSLARLTLRDVSIQGVEHLVGLREICFEMGSRGPGSKPSGNREHSPQAMACYQQLCSALPAGLETLRLGTAGASFGGEGHQLVEALLASQAAAAGSLRRLDLRSGICPAAAADAVAALSSLTSLSLSIRLHHGCSDDSLALRPWPRLRELQLQQLQEKSDNDLDLIIRPSGSGTSSGLTKLVAGGFRLPQGLRGLEQLQELSATGGHFPWRFIEPHEPHLLALGQLGALQQLTRLQLSQTVDHRDWEVLAGLPRLQSLRLTRLFLCGCKASHPARHLTELVVTTQVREAGVPGHLKQGFLSRLLPALERCTLSVYCHSLLPAATLLHGHPLLHTLSLRYSGYVYGMFTSKCFQGSGHLRSLPRLRSLELSFMAGLRDRQGALEGLDGLAEELAGCSSSLQSVRLDLRCLHINARQYWPEMDSALEGAESCSRRLQQALPGLRGPVAVLLDIEQLQFVLLGEMPAAVRRLQDPALLRLEVEVRESLAPVEMAERLWQLQEELAQLESQQPQAGSNAVLALQPHLRAQLVRQELGEAAATLLAQEDYRGDDYQPRYVDEGAQVGYWRGMCHLKWRSHEWDEEAWECRKVGINRASCHVRFSDGIADHYSHNGW